MGRPTKMTPEITKQIGDNIVIGLPYALVAEAPGITYKTFNIWLNKGETEKYWKYFQFCLYIQKRNADAAKALLERLNYAAEAGDSRIYMWILERRFPEEFGRRVYRKTNVVSENKNVNVEINVNDVDEIRNKIINKFV
jgi:transposase